MNTKTAETTTTGADCCYLLTVVDILYCSWRCESYYILINTGTTVTTAVLNTDVAVDGWFR